MIVGITGPSGSGKSTVSEMLRAKGFEVIDADKVAKSIRPQYIPKIVDLFGQDILTDGEFDNKKLALLVFDDSWKLRQLNQILFPPIVARLQEMTKGRRGVTFIDIPILFGSGGEPMFDAVILVMADLDARIKRLIEGRKIAPEVAKKQANSITITYTNAAMCDLVLWTDHDEPATIERKIIEWLKSKEISQPQ